MRLYDLINIEQLGYLIGEKYIRKQLHPTEPLGILNYTDKAQIADASLWRDQPGLKYCRGLIYNTASMEIVARPFPKFWNHGQAGAAEIGLNEPAYTMDKVDGSLGIMYRQPYSGELAIATRGSFTSEQAIHATAKLHDELGYTMGEWPNNLHVADDETFLFEIVFPENRIVVDYGEKDALVLLGSVDLEDGWIFDPYQASVHLNWYGGFAEVFPYERLAEALAAPPRANAEGFVVATPGGSKMVKIKQEDYVRLHKLIFGLSEKRIWQAILDNQTLEQILEPLPDEFHEWVRKVWAGIKGEAIHREVRIRRTYAKIMDQVAWQIYSDREARKIFAGMVKDDPDAWAYFLLYNGRGGDLEQRIIRKHLEPVGDIRPGSLTKED